GSAAGLSQALVSWIGAMCAALVSLLLTSTPSTFVFLWALTVMAAMALLPSVLVLFLDRREAAKPA
ncbi:MAG: Bcr/CflA family drug resistance efflux transporter, partial [Pseudomonadota bacterium]|nr:Bcr/CflA family drug resistance efflux transporter [Pseudomonadota bacterium]